MSTGTSIDCAPVTAVTGARHSEFDVTNTVRVSSVEAVRLEVTRLLAQAWPGHGGDVLWLAFHDFRRLFRGQYPGYLGCDTIYHDLQHTLDMTLAMARLMAGYERSAPEALRLGAERATLGIVTALFHDAGYIRRSGEPARNGAEYTGRHVSRSAEFLAAWLPRVGLAHLVPIATQVVHFTGYECSLDSIELEDPRDSQLGCLLGTADLMAQMADRCYLEKCRDRLYAEFVLAGIAVEPLDDGSVVTRYTSGIDVLAKTPQFHAHAFRERMEVSFKGAYRHIEPLFDGRNPYLEWIERNMAFLALVIESRCWSRLRRRPPCFTVLPAPLESVRGLVSRRLASVNAPLEALAMEN
ncbi:MAG: HD domain-containing protein [Chromatiales bacterium]|nr:HD domain-containing protein [Chromatiales bacterium]